MTQLLDTLGWWQRTFLAMSPEDTERPVPYPDPFLTAVLRASLTSVQDLMVCASTPAVIQAAARSGAGTIAALPGPHPPEALQAAGATHLLDSIAAFPALVLNQPAITGTLFGNKGP